MSRNFNAKILTAVLLTLMLTACSTEEKQSSLPDSGESVFSDDHGVSDIPSGKDHSSIEDTSDSDISDKARDKRRIKKYASDDPVNVYETTLRNGDDAYDCTAYIYFLMEKETDKNRGDAAIEISDSSGIVDRTMLRVGHNLGQMGTEFARDGSDEYFFTAELDSGSVLLSTNKSDDLTEAVVYGVSDNEIVELERYFDDPKDRLDKDASIRNFNLSREFTTDGDNIIFDINGEKVTVSVDFDTMTLKCDEEHENLVYCE